VHAASPKRDTCPRCGNAFHCGVGDAAPCPCTTLRLDAATLAALRESHSSCICMTCLAQLAAPSAANDDGRKMPTPAPDHA
jgi:hypothetical protein